VLQETNALINTRKLHELQLSTRLQETSVAENAQEGTVEEQLLLLQLLVVWVNTLPMDQIHVQIVLQELTVRHLPLLQLHAQMEVIVQDLTG
jgi:hypothetical protein